MRSALVILLAVGAVAGACDQSQGLAKALTAAEATWAANEPAAYEFTVQVICFCPIPQPPPTFAVRDGMATLITTPPQSGFPYSFYDRYNTIDKLFTVLRDYMRQKPARMIVRYDPQLGYPVSAEIDVRQTGVVDDELWFGVTDFKTVEGRNVTAGLKTGHSILETGRSVLLQRATLALEEQPRVGIEHHR
jgi:hypothetical protein